MYFHREPIAVRLGRLADAGRTGVLRVSGDFGGAVYFAEGEVVYAESKRTPGRPARPARLPDRDESARFVASAASGTDRRGGPAAAAVSGPGALGALERECAVREATVDAVLELLTSESRNPPRQRFREGEAPDVGAAPGISVAALLAEVERRRKVMGQLATILTADTTVVRNPRFGSPGLQVTAQQWALLIRMGDRSTPRRLALESGHSVFGTTIEVFRLVVLRLLSVADVPSPPVTATQDEQPDPRRNTVSFLRAVL